MLSFILIALWSPELPSTVQFEAGQLRAESRTVELSKDVKLRWQDSSAQADRILWHETSGCGDYQWTLFNATLEKAPYKLRLSEGEYCPANGSFSLDTPTIETPAGWAHTHRAKGVIKDGSMMRVDLDKGWISPCACGEPPWRVTFERAELDGTCVHTQGTTFRMGDVSILRLSQLSADWVTPYSGPLLPRISWRQRTGWNTLFPLKWSLNSRQSLTMFLGHRGQDASGGASLEWLDPRFGHNVMKMEVTGSDVSVHNRVISDRSWGRIHWVGPWANSSSARINMADDWRPLRGALVNSYAGVSTTQSKVSLGIDAGLSQSLEGEQDVLLPRAWMHWSPELDNWRFDVSTRVDRRPASDIDQSMSESVEGQLSIARLDRIGPLRVSTELNGWYGRTFNVDRVAQRTFGDGQIEAALLWQKSGPNGVHSLGLGMDVRGETVRGSALDHEPRLWRSTQTHRSVGLVHRQSWSSGSTNGYMVLRQGMDPILGDLDPTEMDLHGRWGAVWGQAWIIGEQSQGSSLELGTQRHGLGFHALKHQSSTENGIPWLNRYQRQYDPIIWTSGLGIGPHSRVSLGPIQLRNWALFGGEDLKFYGHGGHLRYVGRCECWFSSLQWNQDVDNEWSQLVFRMGLGADSW